MFPYLTEYFFGVAGVFRAYFSGKITFKRKNVSMEGPFLLRLAFIEGVKWLKGIYMIIKRYCHETPQ